MGRRRTKNIGLPERVYEKHSAYYFVDYQNKWTRLAKAGDKAGMYKALARLIDDKRVPGMTALFERYEKEVLPTKAEKTQKEQKAQIQRLRAVFGKLEPGMITTAHVGGYLDRRSAPVAANREIALLSHVFKKAIRWGLVAINPCTGVERNKEKARDRYVTDDEFRAVYEEAPEIIRVLMALAYLTGQRQADLLKIRLSDLTDEGIFFRQNKRGARLVVQWSDTLRDVVSWAVKRQTKAQSLFVVADSAGQAYRSSTIQTAWQRLMVRCLEDGVLSERFTFQDLRAKARSDGTDKYLLGHVNPDAMARVYQRKPRSVKPVR